MRILVFDNNQRCPVPLKTVATNCKRKNSSSLEDGMVFTLAEILLPSKAMKDSGIATLLIV